MDQSGTVNLTFKVIDSGGLFATKSMSLTVSTQSTNPILGPYAYVPSYMKTMIKKWLYSTEALPFMTVSVIGNGQIRMGDKVFDSFQKVMISENQNIQVQAQPDEKWQFAYWTGDIVDTQNPLQIKAYDHLDVQAVFISPQAQETQYMKGWELNLWLADKQSPEMPVAEIQLGFSETPEQGRCATINPKMFIVSETHANPICNENVSNSGENFRHIRITTDSPQTLFWRYEQQGSGSFELIDALTYEVFIADMTTVQQWDIPELGTMDVIIHYTP
ncbi:MAG: hypothetical protein OMM_00277 [Candidatus Magnetoglobus multicellularis str. Araruama]|uniref:Bacterial repeat domain-containing protein n=1 Tax=Candidatus Magnetoglobus multicellularis str. Araruama TaxID=890399 RepID=A0A1V1PHN3_9BACT|nr:MAG: hypothetical protein OMM_00277 [Candidatus Magnetoglobus multicellularis str. Araruama]